MTRRALVAVLILAAIVTNVAYAHHAPVSTEEWIATQEGLRLEPYRDSAGVLTVCVGHTASVEQRTYTRDECLDLLDADLQRFEQAVDNAIEPDPEGDGRTALVSLAFNIGAGAFTRSRLVKLIQGSYDEWEVTLEWTSWDHAHVNGRAQVIDGLLERRRREVALYYGDE